MKTAQVKSIKSASGRRDKTKSRLSRKGRGSSSQKVLLSSSNKQQSTMMLWRNTFCLYSDAVCYDPVCDTSSAFERSSKDKKNMKQEEADQLILMRLAWASDHDPFILDFRLSVYITVILYIVFTCH